MVREILFTIYSDYRDLVGGGAVIVLFIAAVTASYLMHSSKEHRYVPLILTVPVAIAEAATSFVFLAASAGKKKLYGYASCIFAVLLCILAIASSGEFVFSPDLSEKTVNTMHLPEGLAEVMDEILADSEQPAVLTVPGHGTYFESYSSRFHMMYEDAAASKAAILDEDQRIAFDEFSKIHPDMRKVASAAKRKGCGYVVTPVGMWPDIPITRFGFEVMTENDGYIVYREVNAPL